MSAKSFGSLIFRCTSPKFVLNLASWAHILIRGRWGFIKNIGPSGQFGSSRHVVQPILSLPTRVPGRPPAHKRVRVLTLMTGNGLLLASRSDLWADGPDFSGSNVPSKGPGSPCRLKTCLSGAEKGHLALNRTTSDYVNDGNSPIY